MRAQHAITLDDFTSSMSDEVLMDWKSKITAWENDTQKKAVNPYTEPELGTL